MVLLGWKAAIRVEGPTDAVGTVARGPLGPAVANAPAVAKVNAYFSVCPGGNTTGRLRGDGGTGGMDAMRCGGLISWM